MRTKQIPPMPNEFSGKDGVEHLMSCRDAQQQVSKS